MLRNAKTTIVAIILACGMVFIAGCSGNAQTGTGIGALLGAGIGQLIGGDTEATLIGAGLLAALLWLAGLVSGYSWAAGALTGTYAAFGEGFANTVDQVRLTYSLAALAALVLFGGQVSFAYNAYRTFTSGTPTAHETLVPIDTSEVGR